MDHRKKRGRGKFDQIRRLERRIDYLEGVIYQLFQLTEQLLETVEKLDDDEMPRTSTPTELIALMTVMNWQFIPPDIFLSKNLTVSRHGTIHTDSLSKYDPIRKYISADTEADGRARMVIHLVENKLVTLWGEREYNWTRPMYAEPNRKRKRLR